MTATLTSVFVGVFVVSLAAAALYHEARNRQRMNTTYNLTIPNVGDIMGVNHQQYKILSKHCSKYGIKLLVISNTQPPLSKCLNMSSPWE